MSKPIGPKCNLDCKYCFYLEKEALWGSGEAYRMNAEMLERYVKAYINAQPTDVVNFAWQGGEPTLMGVAFFETVVELQTRYANGKQIHNSLQTNGTLLDDEWGAFLHRNQFLVGLSIDGPQDLHDAYRVGKSGQGSWEQVMRGLEVLKRHQVEWNSLTCVHRGNADQALEVYRFLCEIGSKHLQFIPIVERKPNAEAKDWGLSLASPQALNEALEDDARSPVFNWSVKPQQYGAFLCAIFDQWVRHDVGQIYVQINEVAFAKHAGYPGGLCIFDETCGSAMALEHDGSVYSCDHYVYPSHKLGNINEQSFAEMVESPFQLQFGREKRDALPQQCLECPVKSLCNGGCPKQRFLKDKYGNPGLNYLCEGYYQYFTHTRPQFQRMAELLRSRLAPAQIMQELKD